MRRTLLTTASILAISVGVAFAGSESTVDQIGVNQDAFVNQTDGNEGRSFITQAGENNIARVRQHDDSGGGAWTIPSNTSVINQFTTPGGSPIGARASVEQWGFAAADPGNVSTITQANDGTAMQRARVEQDGMNNSSLIEQGLTNAVRGAMVDGLPTTATRHGQTADVSQVGNDNDSVVDQRGDDGTAWVTQLGDDNMSDVSQAGFDNYADVNQEGIGNTSYITQDANFGDAKVMQLGNDNYSTISQLLRANFAVAEVDQFGSNNSSSITQTSLVIGPGSAGQFADVNQTTDDNTSTIHQDGGDPIGPTPYGNSAIVNQTILAASNSVITQSGSQNTVVINQ